ncbi:MAG: diguanylate cyclase [Nitrospirae bacterium]|nr:diguanylate cyclase [Nitrospirota bacterium]
MKALIADDDQISQRILKTALSKWGYEVTAVQDGAEAWEALQRADSPQLAILDWMMPKLDGIQLCQEIRKRTAQPYTYLLLLTSKTSKSDIVKGLTAGADDYLTKPIDLDELRARIQAGQRILNLQTELIAAREAFQNQATHDSLTGLWNRAAILTALERELARARRKQTSFAVILADLDHFKDTNDTYGHIAGDLVLAEAAKRMRSVLRPYDTIGRYGGEEFLIVLPGCDELGAMHTAERLRTCLDQTPLEITDGHTIPISISLGVALGVADDRGTATQFIKSADAALYRAKGRGRNCVEMAQPEDRESWVVRS